MIGELTPVHSPTRSLTGGTGELPNCYIQLTRRSDHHGYGDIVA